MSRQRLSAALDMQHGWRLVTEARRVVTLLGDREPATATTWLQQHPQIAIVARDRGGGYGAVAAAERLQYEGYLRREDIIVAIMSLAKNGVPIKQIVNRTGHSQGPVRRVLWGERSDVFRVRQSSIEVWLSACRG